jgi:hypothetical protein
MCAVNLILPILKRFSVIGVIGRNGKSVNTHELF